MKNKKFGIGILVVTALAVAAALSLRIVMVRTEIVNGLLNRGAWTPIALTAVLGAAGILLAVLASRLGRQKTFAAILDDNQSWTNLAAAAGVGLVVCNALLLRGEELGVLELVTCGVGILAGVSLLINLGLSVKGVKGSFWVMFPLCLWTILNLICNYQSWSRDPVVVNYCFSTLADAATMLAAYHISAFVFNRGKRRIAAFLCCLAVIFGVVALMDQPLKAGAAPVSVQTFILAVCCCLLAAAALRLLIPAQSKTPAWLAGWLSVAVCLIVPALVMTDPSWQFAQFGIRMSVLVLFLGSLTNLCLRTQDDPKPVPTDEEAAKSEASDLSAAPEESAEPDTASAAGTDEVE